METTEGPSCSPKAYTSYSCTTAQSIFEWIFRQNDTNAGRPWGWCPGRSIALRLELLTIDLRCAGLPKIQVSLFRFSVWEEFLIIFLEKH
jgi:hypothetical protein